MTPPTYLVIDLEATCSDDGSVPRTEMEIIEIGAVLVTDGDFRRVDEFQTLVRPVRHPSLTAFCTELTSITQADIATAPTFADAIAAFKGWLYRDARETQDMLFCSWGDYDRRQLQQDCDFHRLPFPIGARHVNVKEQMRRSQTLSKRPGLGQAIALAGLEFAGTPHRALPDARNIARLLPYIFGADRLPSGG